MSQDSLQKKFVWAGVAVVVTACEGELTCRWVKAVTVGFSGLCKTQRHESLCF